MNADAADADDLAGHVHDLEALQPAALVVPQGGPGAELVTDQLVDLAGGDAGRGGMLGGRGAWPRSRHRGSKYPDLILAGLAAVARQAPGGEDKF